MSRSARRATTAALLRVAAVVGVLAGSAAVAPVAGVATAADTICVALVVDFADLGAGVDSDCVKVPDGSSGEDVLRARHTLGVRPNQPGFVCTIDGWPKEGCGASTGEHYWAYFHRAPGSSTWTYSTMGAASYEPRNNSTEGWVWLTRKDQTPANVPFSAICTATASPRPPPTPSSPPSTSDGKSGAGTVDSSKPTTGRSTEGVDTGTATASTTAAPKATDGRRHNAGAQLQMPPLSPPVTPPPTSATIKAKPATSDRGASVFGLVLGAVIVVGLGAAAVIRARRNRGTP